MHQFLYHYGPTYKDSSICRKFYSFDPTDAASASGEVDSYRTGSVQRLGMSWVWLTLIAATAADQLFRVEDQPGATSFEFKVTSA